MYAPKSDVERTVQLQMERDQDIQQKILSLNVGTFPKRTSILTRILPNFVCLSRGEVNLNLFFISKNRDGEEKSYIVVKKGKVYHCSSKEESYKIMSEREQLPSTEGQNVTEFKISY
jgi:hypothetical protein